jgi:dihydrofolate synthase / folylpolyglutamate synthase
VPASNNSPEYVFDVAHNPAGAWALRSTLSSAYRNSSGGPNIVPHIVLVFGVMRDKAVREMTEILFHIARHVIVTHADNPRSASADEIRLAAERGGNISIEECAGVAEAMERARALAGADDVIVTTGSIYIVGEAMRTLGIRI